MQLVSNMYQGAQDYCQHIPKNTGKQMLIAAGVGFIVRTINSGNPVEGVVLGACSALATLIHGCISPLFRQMVSPRQQLNWGEEMCRSMIGVIAVGCLTAAFGNRTLLNSLMIDALFIGILNYMQPARCNVNSTDWLLVGPTSI